MIGPAAHSDHNASMLNSVIGIGKQGSGDSNFRSQCVFNKSGKPGTLEYLNIIVQENEDIALRLRNPLVV